MSYRMPDEPRVYPFNVGEPLKDWRVCPKCWGYSRTKDFKHEPGCKLPKILDRALRRGFKVQS